MTDLRNYASMQKRKEKMIEVCKHDWVGDSDCVYCRNEELTAENDELTEKAGNLEDDLAELRTHYCEVVSEREQVKEEMHDQIAKRDIRIKELESGINQLSCGYEHRDRFCAQCGWKPPTTVTIQTTQN